jgi:phosphoglucosamine mutase
VTELFGTDGVRGRANVEPVTAATALRLAIATAATFQQGRHRPLAVIGKDTRLSGYMLEPALTAGFTSVGMDVVMTGPLPTPALAMLTRSLRADLGVMISASHNPFEDNGIKIFGPDGVKLSDALEERIAARMRDTAGIELATPDRLGRARRMEDATGRYIEFVKATFPRALRLDGLKVVVDCANGAAYKAAPRVLYELGADVVAIADAPNGVNINAGCGATAPEALAAAVRSEGADLGIALDGDADRVILCDEAGGIADGDQILALIAGELHRTGTLRGGGVVATVMSNAGLERHLARLGLGLSRTKVGDRHVGERMRRDGYNLGGERSGHMIFADYAATGDGLIAALQVLAAVKRSGRAPSRTLAVFEPVPQRLVNVRTSDRAILSDARVARAVQDAERTIAPHGRLLVRPSGTEPVIRIMAECDDQDVVERVIRDLADVIARGATQPVGDAACARA